MFFQRVKTPGIAHLAYVVGAKGEAAVIDPRRDVEDYLRIARENDLTITYVFETHRQEDFVMGSAELARITGAKIVNGRHDLFGHGDLRLACGEELSFAGLRVRALHTPGHTPESMSYAMFAPEAPDLCWGVFSGDTLFVGETGRTDLTDPSKTSENAGLLFDNVHQKLLPLGDQALLFPAHGSGSVCGGNIAERDQSTIGLERAYNPVFTTSRERFMAAKVAERIPRPPYFRTMEKLNLRGGLPVAVKPSEVKVLQPSEFASEMVQGIVIDARDAEAFAGGHLPGSFSIWADGLPVFGGWVAADPGMRVFLVLPDSSELESAVLSLARIGVDGVEGVLAGGFEGWRDAGMPVEESGAVAPRELERRLAEVRVLDVREDSEFEEEGHIPNASHLYVGYLDRHLARIEPPLEKSKPIAVACSVGHRASLAVSILRRRGFERVDNLLGGMTAWSELKLPMENNASNSVTTPQIEEVRA
jgi:hydroxyacylglutathione hydrolase